MINVYEGDLLAQVEICLNSKYPVLNKAPSQVLISIFLLTSSLLIFYTTKLFYFVLSPAKTNDCNVRPFLAVLTMKDNERH